MSSDGAAEPASRPAATERAGDGAGSGGPRWLMPALLALFVASGASGLILQQLWLRLLSLVFGVTVYAAATTLASFMGGLALGGLLAGRIADRVRSPLLMLGVVELGVGAFALATAPALAAVQSAWIALHAWLPDGGPVMGVARFLCAGAVLLVPTTLMGASLPIIVRSSLRHGGATGPRVGALYAANTAGALAGTLLCGLVLIESVGIAASFRIAAALNLCAGLAALALARSPALRVPVGATSPAPPDSAPGIAAPVAGEDDGLLLAAFTLSGFVALALEVVWFRALLGVVSATTSAFAFMLAAVLAGIAGGSALAALVARGPRTARRAWMELALLQTALAAATLVSFRWLGSAHAVTAWLAGAAESGSAHGLLLPAVAAALAILPPALLMGLAFPLGLRLHVEGRPDVARRTGVFCALNLLGGIAGALVAGFVLVPGADLDTSVLSLACASLFGGFMLLLPVAPRAPLLAGSVAVAGLALFVAAALSVGDPLGRAWGERYPREERLWHADGVQTSVAVSRRPDGVTVMYLDGLHQANDSPAMVRYHALIGHMGMLLHADPRRVLCIGLGGGVTAGAAASHPGAEVDVVELSDTVVRAARDFFGRANGHVLERPNVHLRVDDGRNWLAVSGQRYDVITADIIQPRHAGAGSLYSVEYFRLARAALADGGLMVQWVSSPGSESWRLIVRTFLAAFPEATLWCDGTLLIGSLRKFDLSLPDVMRKLEDPDVLRIARELSFTDAVALTSAFTCWPDELRRRAGEGPLLTDDRPLLEYDLAAQASDGK
ncbi:MAG TPA: fused MFS/spermidine synthase [Planctomycetota bacterium]|nr:fused MFS/spermidine synthase [Planctomycetota bacterium]